MKKFKFLPIFLCLSLVLNLVLNGCFFTFTKEEEEKPIEEKPIEEVEEDEEVLSSESQTFAQWQDFEATVKPSVPEYEIVQDLSNVQYADLLYNDEEKDIIAKNGFVVKEGYYNEFFSLYEENRYDAAPNFVTTDSILHTYHLYFNYLLKSLEEKEFYDLAYKLTQDMLNASVEQYEQLKDTYWETAAKRNVGFFSVALQLFGDGENEVHADVKREVDKELALIEKHQGFAESPVMSMDGETSYDEDYSQYVPRGHYTKSEQLERYFKALMWYGRLNFRLDEPDETVSALLMVSAMNKNPEIRKEWNKFFEVINFFVGQPDDLVFLDYEPVAIEAFGDDLSIDVITKDSALFMDFVESAKQLRDPGINSMLVMGTILQPEMSEEEAVEERTEEIKGFRFFGQRFTIDASIFQKLICREVGNKDGTMECPKEDSRTLPKGLDITAAFGSDLAYKLLDEMGETDYAKYQENLDGIKSGIQMLPKEQWTENLYWGWMYTLKSLLPEYAEGYPQFMQSEDWKKKELITFLGNWTELKHDTILYAKQVYAEMGGMPMPEEIDDRGYVEPNPELYAKLVSLAQYMSEGLEQRGLLNEKNKEQLSKLYELLVNLTDISVKELENKELSEEEFELIRNYGGSLEHFWYETFSEEEKQKGDLLINNPAPLVADVATDPNSGMVLEEATGYIDEIYVIFPVDGELRIGRGGVFSYYEFPWPMDDRLTDEKWRDEILFDAEQLPDRPAWQSSYFVER